MGDSLQQEELVIKNTPIENDYIVYWNKKLGSGISGPVRCCKNRTTGVEYALKCLVDRPKARQEVELHWRCTGHPHIVGCVDVYLNEITQPGESIARKCLLMILDLMQGGELFDRIRKKIAFTEKEAAEITRQVASALYHIHSLNIAHRDLKPENLLIKDKSDDVIVKLTDFGFAKFDKGNLMTPQFTPYYVSPQVLEAQRFHRAQKMGNIPVGTEPYTYDKSCDIWSVGVIIYIMLCGYPPFYSENPRKQLSQGMKRRIMHGEYDFPAPEWSKVSDLAKDVVKRMLVISPNERITIPDLVQHPWLNGATTGDIVLQSPRHMLDQDAFEIAVSTHSLLLADMRVPDASFVLNQNAIEKNPIIMKRKKAQSESSSQAEEEVLQMSQHELPPQQQQQQQQQLPEQQAELEHEVVKKTTSNYIDCPAVKSLRNLIAFLYMPPVDKRDSPTFEEFLRVHTLEALKYNSCLNKLHEALKSEYWNGREYTHSVCRNRLAKNLSDIVMYHHNHNNRPPT